MNNLTKQDLRECVDFGVPAKYRNVNRDELLTKQFNFKSLWKAYSFAFKIKKEHADLQYTVVQYDHKVLVSFKINEETGNERKS